MFILRRVLLAISLTTGLLFSSAAFAVDATISGTVTHASDGTAVNGMVVYVENNATGVTSYGYTASDGTYSVDLSDDGNGTAGDYAVYNYAMTNEEPNVIFIRTIQNVSLAEGENKAGVNLSLTRRAKLVGHVYEADGITPVYSAYVYAARTSSFNDGYAADYSTYDGFYSVSPASYPIPSTSAIGSYTVSVTAYGYFGTQMTDINLAADETTTTQNFTLTPESTVSGTVTNTAGVPLAGVTLLLDDLNSSYSYTATTTAAGTFTIRVFDQYDYNGTAVGNYILTASADNYVDRSIAVSITADHSVLTDNDLTMRHAGSLTGRVVAADSGDAVSNVVLTATDGYGKTYTTTSSDDGSFTFSNLRASSNYTVTASQTDYVSTSVYNVVVQVDEVTTLDDTIRLVRAVSLAGDVVTADGNAIVGATVKLFNRAKPRSSGADYTGTSVSDGTFSLAGIAPGRYRVEVSAANYVTLTSNLIDLTDSKSGRTFHLQTAAIVAGQILSGGVPLNQALVTVYSKNPSTIGYGYDYTDAAGNYSISSLAPGRYTIKVSSTGFTEKIIRRRLSGGETTTVNIKVGPAGSIAGYITDADTGLPLSYYTVRVRHQSVSAASDINGYYIIDGLAPGKYKLYVLSTAYETGRSNIVRARSNRVTPSVNFALAPK